MLITARQACWGCMFGNSINQREMQTHVHIKQYYSVLDEYWYCFTHTINESDDAHAFNNHHVFLTNKQILIAEIWIWPSVWFVHLPCHTRYSTAIHTCLQVYDVSLCKLAGAKQHIISIYIDICFGFATAVTVFLMWWHDHWSYCIEQYRVYWWYPWCIGLYGCRYHDMHHRDHDPHHYYDACRSSVDQFVS